jgi:hypothetical protein
VRKDIHRRIRRREPGLDLVADINAVVSVNANRGTRRVPAGEGEERHADQSAEGGAKEASDDANATKGGPEHG